MRRTLGALPLVTGIGVALLGCSCGAPATTSGGGTSATEAPCAQLGPQDQCESASLNVVRTSDAACVTVGAATEQFLFYRAQSSRFTPPLVFERTHVYEQVEVRNEGDAPIPGLLVRL